MRVQQQAAFILHQRHYGETSLLLELFSREYGRVGVIAKGARKPQRKRVTALLPFQKMNVGWSGSGELAVLTAAEAETESILLSGEALFCGFYMNELLTRLLHRHDPHESLFDTYDSILRRLQGNAHNEAMMRIFEKHLLAEIGYGLVLDHNIRDNDPVAVQIDYIYIPDAGPVPDDGHVENGTKISGRALLSLAQENLDDVAVLRECKRLMRAQLARHLGEKPLNSRLLLQGMKQYSHAEGA